MIAAALTEPTHWLVASWKHPYIESLFVVPSNAKKKCSCVSTTPTCKVKNRRVRIGEQHYLRVVHMLEMLLHGYLVHVVSNASLVLLMQIMQVYLIWSHLIWGLMQPSRFTVYSPAAEWVVPKPVASAKQHTRSSDKKSNRDKTEPGSTFCCNATSFSKAPRWPVTYCTECAFLVQSHSRLVKKVVKYHQFLCLLRL